MIVATTRTWWWCPGLLMHMDSLRLLVSPMKPAPNADLNIVFKRLISWSSKCLWFHYLCAKTQDYDMLYGHFQLDLCLIWTLLNHISGHGGRHR